MRKLLGAVVFSPFIFFAVWQACSTTWARDSWVLPIVPHPQEIRIKENLPPFEPNRDTTILIVQKSSASEGAEVKFLNVAFKEVGMAPLRAHRSGRIDLNNEIIIGEMNDLRSVLEKIGLGRAQMGNGYIKPEGYILDVGPGYVLIAGKDRAGTFYGVQSLIQLISHGKQGGRFRIEPVTIIDYPDMPLRSAFYGFYLNALEDDALLRRAYNDLKKIARFKFNMIDLSTHHYGHLEMKVPGHPSEMLWERLSKLFETARRYHLRPRVGGWAKWINTRSPWGADLTTLECIRTNQVIRMKGDREYTLKISNGKNAPNVLYDVATGKSWEKEPVLVTGEYGSPIYLEGRDYILNFGPIRSEEFRKHSNTGQTYLEVLFSKVHYGEGEPAGYPLRWGETFNRPTTIRRLPGGRIPDGEKVKVTFSYIGPDPWSLIKVRYCRSDPRLHTDGPDNYIWRWCTDPIRYLGADDFTLDVDETRVFAWDKRCMESGKSRSRIWADDIRYYYKTIRASNPKARISMWSDMIDPAHNARLYGTEEAASIFLKYGMKDIIMIPWDASLIKESVGFIAGKGFPIMPSCQNETNDHISVAPKWAKYVRDFYSGGESPYGLMYCHWGYAFDTDSTWEQLATVADHAWSVGPYIVHAPVRVAAAGTDIVIKATVEGDKYVFDGSKVRKGPLSLKMAVLYYKSDDQSSFAKIKMSQRGNKIAATIPGSEIKGTDFEYYLSVSDGFNTKYFPEAGNKCPLRIKVE